MVHRFVLIEVVHPNRPPVAAVFLNSRLDASLRRRTTHVVFQAKDARPVSELSLEAQGVAKAYQMTKPRSSDVLLLGKVAAIPRASILSGMLRNLHVWNVLEAGAMYVLSGPTYYYNVECRARRGSSDDTDAPRLLHSGTLLRSGWDVLLKQGVQYDQRIPEASWFYQVFVHDRAVALGSVLGISYHPARALLQLTSRPGSRRARLRRRLGQRP